MVRSGALHICNKSLAFVTDFYVGFPHVSNCTFYKYLHIFMSDLIVLIPDLCTLTCFDDLIKITDEAFSETGEDG